MNSPNLFQYLDMEEIQKLLEAYFKLTGIISAILDPDGNVIVAVGWQDICTRFHRVNPISSARCQESDLSINSRLLVSFFMKTICLSGSASVPRRENSVST